MNLGIYFYMGGWWGGDQGHLFTMLHLLRIVSEDFRDRLTLVKEPLPLPPISGARIHNKKAYRWLTKFG